MTDPHFTHGTMCDAHKESTTVENIKQSDPTARNFLFSVCPISKRSRIRYTSDLPLPKQPTL